MNRNSREPIENFYNTLTDEPLSAEDYERAQQIWNFYNIQTSISIMTII